MRKTVLLTVIILLITSSHCLAADSPTTFRDTTWGMSRADVMKTETGNPVFNKGILLVYDGNISGLASDIVYIFAADQLVRAKYMITERHSNKNMYIDDFNALKERLASKYGKPDKDDIFWRDDLFKNKPQSWGTAISVGHVGYFAIWETPETTIILTLKGDNYKIQLGIEYSSVALKGLEQEQKEKETQDKL